MSGDLYRRLVGLERDVGGVVVPREQTDSQAAWLREVATGRWARHERGLVGDGRQGLGRRDDARHRRQVRIEDVEGDDVVVGSRVIDEIVAAGSAADIRDAAVVQRGSTLR